MAAVAEASHVLENYLARSADPTAAQREIKGWLKAKIAEGHWDILAEVFPRLIIPGLDYTSAFLAPPCARANLRARPAS